jgi:hypothetical protein
MYFHLLWTSTAGGTTTHEDTGSLEFYNILQDLRPTLSPGVVNPHYLQWYCPIDIVTSPDDTGLTVQHCYFIYTSYDGPLSYQLDSTDPWLAHAGTMPIQKPQYFNFTSPGLVLVQNTTSGATWRYEPYYYTPVSGDMPTVLEDPVTIDNTVNLQGIAALYAGRYSTRPDHTGTITIHVKGNTGNIKIGTPITNFDNMRVQSIEETPTSRGMNLTLSDVPIRTFLWFEREKSIQQLAYHGNLHVKLAKEDLNCFQNVTLDNHCHIVDPATPGLTLPPPVTH